MTQTNPDDPSPLGDQFFAEAQKLLDHETHHYSLTTIQALGIMSVREISCGRDLEGRYYSDQSMRLAIEMGLHHKRNDEAADADLLSVQLATFWGAFTLDSMLLLASGSLPQVSCLAKRPPKLVLISDVETSVWVPYGAEGTSTPMGQES
jgi:hypothetical protein